IPTCWTTGPLTITRGAAGSLVACRPCTSNASSSKASTAATTTGMYSGRQPAMTALVAMASIVATPWRGGTTPTTAIGSRPEAAIMRSTNSSVGGTMGKPSVQPLAKYCSMMSMAPRTVSSPVSLGVACPVTISRVLSRRLSVPVMTSTRLHGDGSAPEVRSSARCDGIVPVRGNTPATAATPQTPSPLAGIRLYDGVDDVRGDQDGLFTGDDRVSKRMGHDD